ncbi:PREDICTED: defensin-like protein 109 [Camelina sativa]|uniref:Defensin-like protein 109 n=1 Tax=Camelina sativa TaxID=90675 RepID=A0ABM1QSZ7_CAMSA|nr:PREDICTED: defensin-like protein 109 [Camelina sativa]
MDFTKKIVVVFAFTIMLGICTVHCRPSFKTIPLFEEKYRFTQCFDTAPCMGGMMKCIEFCSSMGTADGQCNNENLCCCTYE